MMVFLREDNVKTNSDIELLVGRNRERMIEPTNRRWKKKIIYIERGYGDVGKTPPLSNLVDV